MTIAGIVKSSLIDYPGFVSCVLFVPGCNFDCFFCHNRSLLDGTHRVLSPDAVEAFLRRRIGLLDAVVISGGEPTLQKDLIAFAETIVNLGFRLKLDTNGSRPDVVKSLLDLGLLNYCAVDYKAPFDRYKEICGSAADAQQVFDTIMLLIKSEIAFEVRTTVLPQLGKEDLITMAKELPPLPRYVLNRYRKPEAYLPCDRERVEKAPYTKAQIEAFADKMSALQPNVTV